MGARSAPIGLAGRRSSRQSVGVAEGMLRVVQLNVDSLVSARWRERGDEIVNWLDELDADVVCLQEIWQDDRHPNTAGWVAEHAAMTGTGSSAVPPPDPAAVGADPSLRFGSAILSRWPCDAVEVMGLPVRRDEQGPHT